MAALDTSNAIQVPEGLVIFAGFDEKVGIEGV